MSLLIKICGLSDPASVEAAIAAGADALGFVFAPSVRRVTALRAAQIAKGVPRGVQRVAVMLHPTDDEWQEVARIFRPDVLQTDAADFAHLEVAPEIACWPVIRKRAAAPPARLPDTFVYEGPESGRGLCVDWSVAAALARKGRMILAGGLDCDNVGDAIHRVAPHGVDVSSALESAPGIKDPERMRAFVAAARAAAEAETEDLAGCHP